MWRFTICCVLWWNTKFLMYNICPDLCFAGLGFICKGVGVTEFSVAEKL